MCVWCHYRLFVQQTSWTCRYHLHTVMFQLFLLVMNSSAMSILLCSAMTCSLASNVFLQMLGVCVVVSWWLFHVLRVGDGYLPNPCVLSLLIVLSHTNEAECSKRGTIGKLPLWSWSGTFACACVCVWLCDLFKRAPAGPAGLPVPTPESDHHLFGYPRTPRLPKKMLSSDFSLPALPPGTALQNLV